MRLISRKSWKLRYADLPGLERVILLIETVPVHHTIKNYERATVRKASKLGMCDGRRVWGVGWPPGV